jgi:virulence factor Mce-like protein
MSRRLRRAAAAIVVIGLLSLGLSACSTIGVDSGPGDYRVTAYFPSAISLYAESQVRVLGLPAGHVKSIKVIGTQVRVVLAVRKDIPVPQNVNATIVPLSLIGERYVQLYPAWKTGQPRLAPNSIIPIARTSVPIEPDEALAALKHLLDSIDPQATGHLVKNLAADLNGTGQQLNAALAGLGTITQTLGDKDDEVGAIIDHFDQLTATLASRDQELGRVLDNFATTTNALADERTAIQSLLASLSSLTANGLDLVNENHVKLDKDITVLSRTLRLVNQHVSQLDDVLDAAPLLVSGPNYDGKAGLVAAYDKKIHALDLRALVSPDLAQAFQALGLPTTAVCVPIQTTCTLPGGVTLPPDLPTVQPVPANAPKKTLLPDLNLRRARADANAASHKTHRGGLAGLMRSISGVFG